MHHDLKPGDLTPKPKPTTYALYVEVDGDVGKEVIEITGTEEDLELMAHLGWVRSGHSVAPVAPEPVPTTEIPPAVEEDELPSSRIDGILMRQMRTSFVPHPHDHNDARWLALLQYLDECARASRAGRRDVRAFIREHLIRENGDINGTAEAALATCQAIVAFLEER